MMETTKNLYDEVSIRTSKITTNLYSTSFSLGIRFLHPSIRKPIYSIYGFVRLGDEIVDTFFNYNNSKLFQRFCGDVYDALDNRISINPILNSFQAVVHQYNIDRKLVDQFLHSMQMDLYKQKYDQEDYKEYILGSAEVVGLMCLYVFCNGNQELYNNLKDQAMALGSAYQKINFLRDLKNDFQVLGRTYFPSLDMQHFDDNVKKAIIEDIEKDFRKGYEGIKRLPQLARFGVYLSYIYYYNLLRKIKKTPSSIILQKRVRISNKHKYAVFVSSALRYKLNLL